jgi:hypothetical protein
MLAYDTGFNDRIADTTYRWHDDSVNFTHENDIKANFAEIMKGQFDTQEMISIIGADDGEVPQRLAARDRGPRQAGPGGRVDSAGPAQLRDTPASNTVRSSRSDSRTRQPPRSRKEPFR